MHKFKKNICLCIFAVMQALSHAQTNHGACIVQKTYTSPDTTHYVESRVYGNGLGDIVEEVQVGVTPSKNSLVVLKELDSFRRPSKAWLPVNTLTNGFVSPEVIKASSQSQYDDSKAYTLTNYNPIHSDMESDVYKPGFGWHDNSKCVNHKYTFSGGVSFESPFEGVLFRSTSGAFVLHYTTNEDGQIQTEAFNSKGKKIWTSTGAGKTYYVYDFRGLLAYVLPPELAYILERSNAYGINDTNDDMRKYAYCYKYDYAGRCIYKKLPGCEPFYYIYDASGNCVLSQDGNQRSRGKWMFSIPDRLGRMCLKGMCSGNYSYKSEPLHNVYVYAEFNKSSKETKRYDICGISMDNVEILEANYYDSYDFLSPSLTDLQCIKDGSLPDTLISKGLLTGKAVAYFDNSGILGYTTSAIYYDTYRRPVQTHQSTHMGTYEHTQTKYTFSGKPQNISVRHGLPGGGMLKEMTAYTYDHAERQTNTWHRLDENDAVLLARYEYDELGRKSKCILPGRLPAINYTYNIQSALKGIKVGKLFTEELLYNEDKNGNTPLWGGNISSVSWQHKENDTPKETYNYEYDTAMRLSSASYLSEGTGTTAPDFSTSYEYDRNGNITSINRFGLNDLRQYSMISSLNCTYDGNQLKSVSDDYTAPSYTGYMGFCDDDNESEREYTYDANGNMTSDRNKGIDHIDYNIMNLPSYIQFSNGNAIRYIYDANGTKLRVAYETALSNIGNMGLTGSLIEWPLRNRDVTSTRDYVGNLIFGNGVLDIIKTDNGTISVKKDVDPSKWYTYLFNITDHQDNVRVVVNASGSILERNDYYPYGMLTQNRSFDYQPFKYSSKELDRMHGLNMYDHGVRMSDPALGRWHVVDPLCEKYYDVSPYVLCGNDPVNFVDRDGREIDLSSLSKEQYDIYMKSIEKYSSNNELFSQLYKEIDASSYIYSVKLGKWTGANDRIVQGQFSENECGGGELRYDIDDFMNGTLDEQSFAEEMFHAYQSENIYQGNFNKEFEAKTFCVAMRGIGSCYQTSDDWFVNVSSLKYGNDNQVISPIIINSNEFLDDYLKSANTYSNYNKPLGYGPNYTVKTESRPISLIKIITNAYN